MKKVRGYIFSRSFAGERAPQHVQNIVIRDYCQNNSLKYLLSASEYKMKNSFIILNGLISKLNSIDGIVAYSVFQLPEKKNERNLIVKKILKKKKIIFFAVEKMKISNLKELEKINIIWRIKQTVGNCPKKI
jgi:sporadic carbohydrate cluster protein (TIGR04323 family)